MELFFWREGVGKIYEWKFKGRKTTVLDKQIRFPKKDKIMRDGKNVLILTRNFFSSRDRDFQQFMQN